MAESRSDKGGCFAAILLLLTVAYCHHRSGRTDSAMPSTAIAASGNADARDGELAYDQSDGIGAEGEVRAGETYAEYDDRRDALDTGSYSGGDECTEDCGGHDAGRQWAESHSISDPSECGGNSWSFEEGCRSYAQEQQGEQSSDDGTETDGGTDPQ